MQRTSAEIPVGTRPSPRGTPSRDEPRVTVPKATTLVFWPEEQPNESAAVLPSIRDAQKQK